MVTTFRLPVSSLHHQRKRIRIDPGNNGGVASPESASIHLTPLCTGRLFHRDQLDEVICRFRGVDSILSRLFFMENL